MIYWKYTLKKISRVAKCQCFYIEQIFQTKCYTTIQLYCMNSHTFYPNLPIFLHRYICHICDILQLWSPSPWPTALSSLSPTQMDERLGPRSSALWIWGSLEHQGELLLLLSMVLEIEKMKQQSRSWTMTLVMCVRLQLEHSAGLGCRFILVV